MVVDKGKSQRLSRFSWRHWPIYTWTGP